MLLQLDCVKPFVSKCMYQLLSNCTMENYPKIHLNATSLFDVDRLYVMHARKNVKRGKFQLEQLKRLNTASWFVTGCDGTDLSVQHQKCAWVASSDVSIPRGSQVIKANAALAHFLCSPVQTIMMLEVTCMA